MEEHEEGVLRTILKENNWNQTKVAEELNVSRRTLVEKINKYSLIKNG